MAIDRTIWKNYFTNEGVPEWICPTCKKGILKADKTDFIIKEGSVSKSYHGEEDWDPAWISGVFSGMLHCDSPTCKEDVAIAGKMDVRDEQVYLGEDYYDYVSREVLMPELFIPGLELFPIQSNIPNEIAQQIKDAFYLFWVDSSSCGNKIRIIVELIMDYYKVKKIKLDGHGKRRGLSLHSRIEAFRAKFPNEADMLMAIKWIGNSGSHSSEKLTKDDTLDGFEILEHVVHKLYETETKRIRDLSKTINKRKGPIKKRPTPRRR